MLSSKSISNIFASTSSNHFRYNSLNDRITSWLFHLIKLTSNDFFFITKHQAKKLYHKRKSEFQSENIKFLIEQFQNIIHIQYCENNLNLIQASNCIIL